MKKLLVVLLVLGLAAPAMAQSQWNFYGSVRTHIGYYEANLDYLGGPSQDGNIASDLTESDAGTLFKLQGNTRLGARVQATDKLSGHIELALAGTNSLRLAYGTWKFGAGALTVGQHYTPATFLGYSAQYGDVASYDGNMLVSGLPYIGRRAQIRLSMAGLDLALIENNSGAADYGYDDRDFWLPRLEAAYTFSTDMVSIRPVAGFQTYKVHDTGPTGDGMTITSWLAGLGVSLKLGPAYVKATGSYMINAANYGQLTGTILTGTGAGGPLVNAGGLVGFNILNAQQTGNGLEDSALMQGTLVAGFRLSPMLGVEAGFGIMNAKVDVAPNVEAEQTGYIYYLQVPVTVTKGFTIVPEIGQSDRGDLKITGNPDLDNGKIFYAAMKLQIDF